MATTGPPRAPSRPCGPAGVREAPGSAPAPDGSPLRATLREEARVAALWRTGLLDTPPEEAFDRLTRLARRLLGAPIALLSLVDSDRQFFKSALGLPEPWAARRQMPLSHSFCRHVVATGEPLMVEDARLHPLVRGNLAVPEVGIVAYLGTPLATADGHAVGSLCAIDTQPREWTAGDAAALHDLAAIAMNEMSLRAVAIGLEAWLREADAARDAARARELRLEALGRLAGGTAREFAGMLQAVQSGARTAAARLGRDADAVAAILAQVGDAARRGGALTERLSASAARAGEVRAVRVEAGALLRRVQAEVLAACPEAPLQVRVDAPPDLPAVLADPEELGAVLLGLAAAARDGMPEFGTLALAAALDRAAEGAAPHPARLRPGRYVRFSVADTGTGLGRGAAAGAGLDIAVARDFAERAGGALLRESEAGAGSVVALWLPAAEPAEADTGE